MQKQTIKKLNNMKIITKAYSNNDWYYPDYCILNVSEELKQKIRVSREYIKNYSGDGHIEVKHFGCNFDFYNLSDEEDLCPEVVNNWFATAEKGCDPNPSEIDIPNDIELNQMDIRLDTFKLTVGKYGIDLYAYGKYDSSIEYYAPSISFETLKLDSDEA
jgi:hypothetical protein